MINIDQICLHSAYTVLTRCLAPEEPAMPRLTLNRIRNAKLPPNKKQIFLWDEDAKGLGVRITGSAKVFIFQSRMLMPDKNGILKPSTFRIKIGGCDSVLLEDARNVARRYAAQVAEGIDPRQARQRTAENEATERQERKRQDVTIGKAWPTYMEERRPNWSTKYYSDHERIISPGGKQKKRGKGLTVAGPLASIANLPLSSVTADSIKKWLADEQPKRPTETRRAFEMLRTFLNWCEADKRYHGLAPPNACSAKIKKDNLTKKNSRDDALQREQLSVWFASVRRYENKVLSAYVQMLFLIGARREELLSLKWSDVDFRWKKVHILGKGAVPRDLPLTPYVAALLSKLPRRNEWVFSSTRGKEGRLQSPTKAFQKMMSRAEIDDITLHGLRRSFSTLSEWLETPVGIVYQIQGHEPSATAEKHYKKRPVDLLRKWHIKIEAWILEEAGVEVPGADQETGFRLVKIV
ncbi:related to integrase [Desulfotalea psychrophila LSv54]|uniref:Related to integrase n=2 Tax=Desulfotalea psychrophila TaxID=84980 RepID=Q6ARX0_DESPS|nr:related to integrase [Desulfotalea psychrophila LSv54]